MTMARAPSARLAVKALIGLPIPDLEATLRIVYCGTVRKPLIIGTSPLAEGDHLIDGRVRLGSRPCRPDRPWRRSAVGCDAEAAKQKADIRSSPPHSTVEPMICASPDIS
jgi:hypothetical protein